MRNKRLPLFVRRERREYHAEQLSSNGRQYSIAPRLFRLAATSAFFYSFSALCNFHTLLLPVPLTMSFMELSFFRLHNAFRLVFYLPISTVHDPLSKRLGGQYSRIQRRVSAPGGKETEFFLGSSKHRTTRWSLQWLLLHMDSWKRYEHFLKTHRGTFVWPNI
jgi:hypothetical protein